MESESPNRVLYRVQFGLRIALLLVLLYGALVVSATSRPSARTFGQFRAALTAGEVDRVTWRGDSGGIWQLHWSESPLIWHEAPPEKLAGDGGPYTPERLDADLDRSRIRPLAEHLDNRNSGSILPEWPFWFPGVGFLPWLAAAWVIAFVVMVGSRPRLGNRWAWFWLFTVGEIGALLFLVLEPRPLWKGPGPGAAESKPISGHTGCLYSILLAIVSIGLALGVGELVRLLLG
ncbi:hypothetical protein [Herbidospora mongoliensis]|uniref:hypothetical protein n=1 Tax=Herbidospora mongoliensis TaxID=688067 RepID=UPI0008358ADB|nr:hypothetical protein [Herbidospora mongoliensis]